MTYSSRNFLISWGVGSEDRVPRFSKRLSSAMMSLQTSTHSSQMNTVGPAMSFRTSFWSLLQKEQRKTSVSPAFFTMLAARPWPQPMHARLGPFPDDIVNNTVFIALIGRHDVIALGVVLDAFDRLARVKYEDFVETLPHPQNLTRGNIDIGRLPPQSGHQGLVNHNSGIRERKPFPLRALRESHP